MSMVPGSGGGVLSNMLNMVPSTVVGTATTVCKEIGLCVNTGAGANYNQFTNTFPTTAPASIVAACIFIPTATASFGTFIQDANTNASPNKFGLLTGVLAISGSGNNHSSSLSALTNGVPWFVAVSWNATTQNYVQINLKSGERRFTTTSLANTMGTTTVNWVVACDSTAGDQLNGGVAAVMMALDTFINLPDLLQWADDPWSYWYPQSEENWVGVAAAGDILMPMICM